MKISDEALRRLCRSEDGGRESKRFQEALSISPMEDPVSVQFEVGFNEYKNFELPREDVERYAEIARQEAKPEEELLECLKPEVRGWVLNNRRKMVEKLREARSKFYPEYHTHVTIIWSIHAPDSAPVEIVDAYLNKYGVNL